MPLRPHPTIHLLSPTCLGLLPLLRELLPAVVVDHFASPLHLIARSAGPPSVLVVGLTADADTWLSALEVLACDPAPRLLLVPDCLRDDLTAEHLRPHLDRSLPWPADRAALRTALEGMLGPKAIAPVA